MQLGNLRDLGDINGDSFDDFVISESLPGGYNGTAYVIFGGANLPSVIDITTLDGTNGFSIVWSIGEVLSSITAGDFNSDGYRDIVVAGDRRLAVLFNYRNVWQASIDLNNYTLYYSVLNAAGIVGFLDGNVDLNGDSINDLLAPIIYGVSYIYGAAGYIPGVPSLSASPSLTASASPAPSSSSTSTPVVSPTADPSSSASVFGFLFTI